MMSLKQESITQPVLYRSIHKLPFSVFVDAICDGELSGLLISGEATQQQLTAVWEDLLMEYQDVIGGDENEYINDLYKRAYKDEILFLHIDTILSVMQERYVPKFANYLRQFVAPDLKFDVTDPEGYERDLKRCTVRLPAKKLILQETLKELEDELNRRASGSTEKPKRDYYTKVLINLSDHAGYAVKEHDITVYEFCERVRRLNAYIQKSQTKKQWEQSED
jgi:hypothetical protein